MSSDGLGPPSLQHVIMLSMKGSPLVCDPLSSSRRQVGSNIRLVHQMVTASWNEVSRWVLVPHRTCRPPSDAPTRGTGKPFRLPLRDGKYISGRVMSKAVVSRWETGEESACSFSAVGCSVASSRSLQCRVDSTSCWTTATLQIRSGWGLLSPDAFSAPTDVNCGGCVHRHPIWSGATMDSHGCLCRRYIVVSMQRRGFPPRGPRCSSRSQLWTRSAHSV